MELSDYLKVMSSLLTACSILFAIYVFKRNEDRRTFAIFRDSLGNLRRNVNKIDNLMSSPEFSITASNIIHEIRKLKPESYSKKDFLNYLEDKANHDHIAHAIYIGRNNSKAIKDGQDTLSEITISPYLYKEKLPITSMVLGKLIFYISRVASTVTSPKLFNLGIGNPESIQKHLIPAIEKYENFEHIFAEMSVFTAAFPMTAMQMDQNGQELFDEAEKLIIILSDTFAQMTDAQLRESSKAQKNNYNKAKAINNKHAIEDCFDYLKLLKRHFSGDDWDLIVESKTKILKLVEKKNN